MGLFSKKPKPMETPPQGALDMAAEINRSAERAARAEQEVFSIGDRVRAFGSEGNVVEIDEAGPKLIYVVFAEDIEQLLRCEPHQLERV